MGLFDRLRGRDGPRVAFIGIDGVPFSLIERHPDVFTTLHSLMNQGSGGPIDSIVPPESSACWPSLTTGVNPGKTGVYGFQDREIGSYETYVPTGRDVQATRLWDYVHRADRQATVMNVPVTVPAQRDVQRMVAGFLATDLENATHPPEFATALQDMGYRIDVDARLGHDADKEAFLTDARETIDARTKAFEHYIEQDDWDLFFGVYMASDRVNHFLFEDFETDGEYADAFLDFYRRLDEHIGRLVEVLPDDVHTIVASDHGFTTQHYEVHLNRWLESAGWLSFDTDEPDVLGDIASDTTAYSLIPGRLYLNLEGREPRGSVPQSDYDETLDDLEAAVADITGPDGEPVIERVVRGADVFDGPHVEIAPDLVALPHDGFDLKAGFSGGTGVFEHGPRNGMHTFANASLITDLPDVTLDQTTLYDVCPTVLDLMDVEVDMAAFDGTSLA